MTSVVFSSVFIEFICVKDFKFAVMLLVNRLKFSFSLLHHYCVLYDLFYAVFYMCASNYKDVQRCTETLYTGTRYDISHDDWHKDISHLIGKVKLKFQQDFQSRNTAQTLVELCAIRDGLSTCNALSYLDACELINLISLD